MLKLPGFVPTGEASTAEIARCSPVAGQLRVYHGGSRKLSNRDVLIAFIVSPSFVEQAHVNCIFRTISRKSPVQHSFDYADVSVTCARLQEWTSGRAHHLR